MTHSICSKHQFICDKTIVTFLYEAVTEIIQSKHLLNWRRFIHAKTSDVFI